MLKRVGERFSWVATTVLLGLVVALVISKVFVATFEKMALLAAVPAGHHRHRRRRRTAVVHPGGAGHRPRHPVLPAHPVPSSPAKPPPAWPWAQAAASSPPAAAYLINMGTPDILNLSVAVLIGMVISVTAAACVGTVQPIIFYKLNRDPAVAAGPLGHRLQRPCWAPRCTWWWRRRYRRSWPCDGLLRAREACPWCGRFIRHAQQGIA